MINKFNLKWVFVFVFFFGSAETSYAGRPLFEAVDLLVEQISKDSKELFGVAPTSTIVSLTHTDNIETDLREYLLKNLEGLRETEHEFHFVQCKNCFQLKATAQADRVLVKKGITSKEEVLKVCDELAVKTYTECKIST